MGTVVQPAVGFKASLASIPPLLMGSTGSCSTHQVSPVSNPMEVLLTHLLRLSRCTTDRLAGVNAHMLRTQCADPIGSEQQRSSWRRPGPCTALGGNGDCKTWIWGERTLRCRHFGEEEGTRTRMWTERPQCCRTWLQTGHRPHPTCSCPGLRGALLTRAALPMAPAPVPAARQQGQVPLSRDVMHVCSRSLGSPAGKVQGD